MQSAEIAGFQARNWDRVREYWDATEGQVLPDVTMCHLLQVGGWPGWVGPGGVGEVGEVVVGGEVVVVVVGEGEVEVPTQ